MKYEELTEEAHRQGFILKAMSDPVRSTVVAVANGRGCAAELADDRRVELTAASNRLARAARMNLIEVDRFVGIVKFYRLSEYGKSMPWVRAARLEELGITEEDVADPMDFLPVGDQAPPYTLNSYAVKRYRCGMCDAWYLPHEAAEHNHKLPQSGPLRTRWLASKLPWSEFHDQDQEAREWGHRDARS